MKKPLIVSACLLGDPVRYDGQAKGLSAERLKRLSEEFTLIRVCPECLGGLPTPRAPAELQPGCSGHEVLQGQGLVMTATGKDVTQAFISGARQTLTIAMRHGVQLALLKANSPSCGNNAIYDGHFTGQQCTGEGVTATILLQAGIMVFNEEEYEALLQHA